MSILANKYLETHFEEDYKKNLRGRKLKAFLSESKHFTCTGDRVTIVEGMIKGNFDYLGLSLDLCRE